MADLNHQSRNFSVRNQTENSWQKLVDTFLQKSQEIQASQLEGGLSQSEL